jgi:RNA polymerase sigma factor (TIGR02999 family)
MRREPAGHALQTTALVHEAFLRLPGTHAVDWRDRGHFLAVAARVMRRVLVDVARENQSQKRGEGAVHVPLDEQLNAPGPSLPDLVALDEALDQLGRIDPRKVQVIELRFFGGLTVDETAKVLEVSPDTVARDWRMARTWLLRRLSDPRD